MPRYIGRGRVPKSVEERLSGPHGGRKVTDETGWRRAPRHHSTGFDHVSAARVQRRIRDRSRARQVAKPCRGNLISAIPSRRRCTVATSDNVVEFDQFVVVEEAATTAAVCRPVSVKVCLRLRLKVLRYEEAPCFLARVTFAEITTVSSIVFAVGRGGRGETRHLLIAG